MRQLAGAFTLTGAYLMNAAAVPAESIQPAPNTCDLDIGQEIIKAKCQKNKMIGQFRLEIRKLLKEYPEFSQKYSALLENGQIRIQFEYAGMKKCGTVMPDDFLGYFKVNDGKLNIILNEGCFDQQLVLARCIPELKQNTAKILARSWLPVFVHEMEHAIHQINIKRDYKLMTHEVPIEEEECACIMSTVFAFKLRAAMIAENCCKEELAFFDKSNYWLWSLRDSLIAGNIHSPEGVVHRYYQQFNLVPLTDPQLIAYFKAELTAANYALNSAMPAIKAQDKPLDWVGLIDSRITAN